MLKIIDYSDLYNSQIDSLDEKYWGNNENEKVSAEIKENDIVKIALLNDMVVGFLHFKVIGDLVDCYHILVDNDFQNRGIATSLLKEALIETYEKKIQTLVAHAVEHDGVVNAKKLLENFGFIEIYRVKNYWGALYPNEYCKQCDSNQCHCGVVVFLKRIEY